MGSDTGQEDESPPHVVEIRPFHIGRYAVSNRFYAAFITATGVTPPPFWNVPPFDEPDQPVVGVNWFEAGAYCRWLGDRSGIVFRLPTEAEREYACRAGTSTAYPWGDLPDDPARLSSGYGSRWVTGPEVVGGPPNGFGLCNMADNVHEWCADWYGRDCYRKSESTDPRGPHTGKRRVSRGGSWRHHIKVTRSSARSALDPGFRYADYGFRIAADLRGS
jgi:formylglycine-generating enzyme required for sulfatase activity